MTAAAWARSESMSEEIVGSHYSLVVTSGICECFVFIVIVAA